MTINLPKLIYIPTDELFKVLPRKVLFEARWGFTKGNLSNEEYKYIIDNKAIPALEKLIKQEQQNSLIDCKAVYGIFQVVSKDNKILIPEKNIEFEFPRQKQPPNLCISDFFDNKDDDIIAFFAVTIGNKIIEAEKKLFENNCYYDYHILHGLGAELADCGAVCIHNIISNEVFPDFSIDTSKRKGLRYSFGYPSCPDLSYQKKLFELLNPSQIGLSLTQSYQMVPELSVSGFIIFNEKARYFVP